MDSQFKDKMLFLFDGPFDDFVLSVVDSLEKLSDSSDEVRDAIGISVVRAVSATLSIIKGEEVKDHEKLDQDNQDIVISLIDSYEQFLNTQKVFVEDFRGNTNKYDDIFEALQEFKKIVLNDLKPKP